MTARAIRGGASASPLAVEAALAVILAQPRAVISGVTAHLIERLDQLDGDPDLEPEEDCCPSGDDAMRSETAWSVSVDHGPGDPEDAEDDTEDRCLAGDDGVFAGQAVFGALGFDSTLNPYAIGADEDCEREGAL